MIIQSKFKDYYDYVAFQYGGGDPRVVYARKPLTITPEIRKEFNKEFYTEYYELRARLVEESSTCEFGLSTVLFCGRLFYIAETKEEFRGGKNNWQLLTPSFLDSLRNGEYTVERNGDNFKRINAKEVNWRYNTFRDYYVRKAYNQLKPLSEQPVIPWVLQLHRFFGAPVLQSSDGVCTSSPVKEIPILSRLGFAAHFPAEQVYQELALFMGNTLNTNPDITPPAKVSDKDRILQHGFDLKRSFRH